MNKAKRIRWIFLFVLITVLSICAICFILDFPSFSAEMAMHREEAMHWVGPSRVIAADDVDYFFNDHILIGETDYGYTLFEYSDDHDWDFGSLNYHEKHNGATCFASDYGNRDLLLYDGEHKVLPVYAIPEDAGAVSARLTLYAADNYHSEFYEVTCVAQAELRQDTFFLFEVDVSEMDVGVRRFWMARLNGRNNGNIYLSGNATLELFDRDGALIDTIVMEFPATV